MDIPFFLESAALGVGLAMDAFSVSLSNGLAEPRMGRGRLLSIAGVFAGFQALMPLLGWFSAHTLTDIFLSLRPLIPWASLLLLLIIGAKLLSDGVKRTDCCPGAASLSPAAILLQGVATSIDALSAGFTIARSGPLAALTEAGIIAAVTFPICAVGIAVGRRFGTRLAGRARLLGGVILILIGVEIFVTGIL